jgi:hypothetical protein
MKPKHPHLLSVEDTVELLFGCIALAIMAFAFYRAWYG